MKESNDSYQTIRERVFCVRIFGKNVASKPDPPADLPTYVGEPLQRQDPETLEVIRDYVGDLLAYHRAHRAADLEDDELAADDEQLVDVDED